MCDSTLSFLFCKKDLCSIKAIHYYYTAIVQIKIIIQAFVSIILSSQINSGCLTLIIGIIITITTLPSSTFKRERKKFKSETHPPKVTTAES